MRRGGRHGETGSATIELAFATPLLILLAFGAFDFGRVFYYAIAVSGAAHAGAQYGSQSIGKAFDIVGMQQAAQNHAPGLGITATAASPPECRCATSATVACNTSCSPAIKVYAMVTATRTFTTVVDYPGIPHSFTVSRTARIRAQ